MTNEQVQELQNMVDKMEEQLVDIETYLKSVEKVAYDARTIIEGLETDIANRVHRAKYYSDFPTDREYLDIMESDLSRLWDIRTMIQEGIV